MDQTQQIEAIAALEEPARRALYEYVAGSGRAVGRDEAAAATGVKRALAAFHLDRLVEEGLLEVEFKRLSGRSGRGAGRPNKLYRRPDRSFEVQLPPRQYELAAEIITRALEASGEIGREALWRVAHESGAALARRATEDGSGETERSQRVVDVLGGLGFEPRSDGAGRVRLGNCPFSALVPEHRDTTCGMNLALVRGVLHGLASEGLASSLDPQPTGCCVVLDIDQGAGGPGAGG